MDRRHISRTESDLEVWQLGGTRECEETLVLIERSAIDLVVISPGNVVVDHEKRSPGVGDCRAPGTVPLDLVVADLESVRLDLPETLRRINLDGGEFSLESRGIDLAELVESRGFMLELRRHYGQSKIILNGVEEGLLLLWCDGIDATKRKATRPSEAVSCMKLWETSVASSTACSVATAPPISTVSVPTMFPEAAEPSPKLIEKEELPSCLNVDDLSGSNTP